jgi:hypothetical protein
MDAAYDNSLFSIITRLAVIRDLISKHRDLNAFALNEIRLALEGILSQIEDSVYDVTESDDDFDGIEVEEIQDFEEDDDDWSVPLVTD